ncbi:MAG: molecular chaperone [Hyphomicrobiaceae bacterium]
MSVTPVVVDMAVGGRQRELPSGSSTTARSRCRSSLIYKLDVGPKGETTEGRRGRVSRLPAAQASVPPGATQVFRIQWVGKADIKKSESYIFSVNQIPVKLPKSVSGVQIVFNFAVVVNVAPPGGVADLKYIGAGTGKDDKGKIRPAITVENTGNMHAYLLEATINLSAVVSKSLAPGDIRQLMGLGLVQPGKQRRFLVPVDLPAGVGNVTASISYKRKTAR